MANRVKPRAVEDFESYPEHLYSEIALAALAAFAIARLRDLHIPNTFENLVVALYKFFPAKFSLLGFNQYPDAASVGRTLLQLGPKYRNWARGSVQKGFVLTDAGNAKALDVAKALSGIQIFEPQRLKPRTSRPRTMDLSKDIRAIEESSLFRQWKAGAIKRSNSLELFDLLGAYAYTPARVLIGRVKTLETIATELGRQDIQDFLSAVRREFADQFRE
jgi:hypothetical protein